ncbi:MAG TPA: molybdopterin-guanine dinucleotide biosynthesis protein B [Thermoanaerobaculia bacterium]|nr:molybdopterin-guanine dinucleotide biosynthesis protein B [Thermoanaerobaculia bacterium]
MISRARPTVPGIDSLLEDPSPVEGRRIGLITNHAAFTAAGIPSWKALARSGRTKLARLFGPEHGIDGGAVYMEGVSSSIHRESGLPVVSLYGTTRESLAPKPEDLADLDAVVFDVPDVGSRYYTFHWTMLLAMEACAALGKRFVVCDRPNPIGGEVEGAPQEADFLSFVGLHPIAVRHGLTTGELARLLVFERGLDLDLAVCRMRGWARDVPWSDTGLTWVPPSPNIPTVKTARVYPGMCLLEGTNLSEGRGTARPFEMFGAPWLEPLAFAAALDGLALSGVSFLPTRFRPMFEKHAGETCGGALAQVTDPSVFRSFETGLRVIETARNLAPSRFRWRTEPYEFDSRPAIDLLTGSARFREALDAGAGATGEASRHRDEERRFLARRGPFLLYPDHRPAILAFVGGHDSGKTTVLTETIARLRARGLSVGSVKHTSRAFEDDTVGKDSQRLGASGANVWALVTPERATVRSSVEESEFPEFVRRHFSDCDVVLVEGFKSLPIPKIEVTRAGAARPPIPDALARISDRPSADSVPTCRFDDAEGIVALVLRLTGLDRAQS